MPYREPEDFDPHVEPCGEDLADAPGRIGRPRNVGRARWALRSVAEPKRWRSTAVTNALAATADIPPLLSEATARVRFWPYVDREGGPVHHKLGTRCWPWTGRRDRWGYGTFTRLGANVRAHRYALELAIGPIGDAYACHKCNNPWCCNPEHLYPGDAQSNADDAKEARAQRLAEQMTGPAEPV